MASKEKLPTVKELFDRLGCRGYWKEEYQTMAIPDIIPKLPLSVGALRLRLQGLHRKMEALEGQVTDDEARSAAKAVAGFVGPQSAPTKRDDTLNMALSAGGALNVLMWHVDQMGAYGDEQDASKARMLEDLSAVAREMEVFIRLRQQMK